MATKSRLVTTVIVGEELHGESVRDDLWDRLCYEGGDRMKTFRRDEVPERSTQALFAELPNGNVMVRFFNNDFFDLGGWVSYDDTKLTPPKGDTE